jgi:hypothetical protein
MIDRPTSLEAASGESDPWSDLNAGLGEARGLLTSLAMLQSNAGQQLRLIAMLGVALGGLLGFLAYIGTIRPGAGLDEHGVAIALVLVFGLGSSMTQLFRLRGCIRGIQIAIDALSRELNVAEASVHEHGARAGTSPTGATVRSPE